MSRPLGSGLLAVAPDEDKAEGAMLAVDGRQHAVTGEAADGASLGFPVSR